MSDRIQVAAAVIRRNGETFICSRPKKSSLGGFWEFPGGKCEPGETPEDCIVRELREELGIEAVPFDRIYQLDHDYPDKKVRVYFIRCIVRGDSPAPVPYDGQEFKWVSTKELDRQNFLPADLPFAELLAKSLQ